ncbi:MAG: hypothetical protein AAF830_14285 [Pseudomonadota bacterium]
MILGLVSLILLFGGVVIRRLKLSPQGRFRVAALLLGSCLLAILLVSWRMTPLSILSFLVGIGLAANTALRDRMRTREFGEEPQFQAPRPKAGTMERSEALAILGLEGSPSVEDITAAHKRMIVRAHPDQGGSDYLAAKVNEARQVLLGD